MFYDGAHFLAVQNYAVQSADTGVFHTRTQLQRSATLPSKFEATQVAQQRVTVPPKGHQIQQSNVTRLNDPDSRAQKQVTALLANARPRVQS